MTTGELLARLFNLSQHTGTLNSPRAAADFWLLAGVGACVAIAVALLFTNRRHA
jgi:hypothetical protein